MLAKLCQSCQENQRNPAKAPLHPWETSQQPWKRLHIDFAGPFEGHMWLIVIDACSKWPEVIAMTSTTAEKTINALKSLFSRYGIPDHVVSDNGPQFVAEEFKQFCLNNGIQHTLIAPYHPSSNGEAKRFVQTFKSSMKRGKGTLQKPVFAALPKHSPYSHWKDSCRTHVWQKNQNKIGSATPTTSAWATISTDTEAKE